MGKYKIFGHDGKISAMTSNLAAHAKSELRKKILQARKAREFIAELSTAFNVHLAELCLETGASRIACYLPFGNEPDVELFLDWALENNIEILLPVANKDGTMHWVIFDGATKQGVLGFTEADGQVSKPEQIDLAIIPALAVSKTGIRLGRGKGYYDKALPQFDPLPPVVAVVFEDELLEEIASEPHDHPVDAVITPAGITRFNERLK
jgi:5-formyltetrahydrofolate cyclo-ligase